MKIDRIYTIIMWLPLMYSVHVQVCNIHHMIHRLSRNPLTNFSLSVCLMHKPSYLTVGATCGRLPVLKREQ